MELITGKNKEEFEKWFKEEVAMDLGNIYNGFYGLDFEMQSGVITAYYDSVGIDVDVRKREPSCKFVWSIWSNSSEVPCSRKDLSTRNEALKEAFKQANDLRNKEL